MIKLNYYLNKLIASKDNGRVNEIIGLRIFGKSYLLYNIFLII